MKIQKLSLAVVFFLALSPAYAEEIATFENSFGWKGGQSSNREYFENLVVSIETRRAVTQGKMNVVAEFCNNSANTWNGGIRLSPNRPTRSHASLTVPGRSCKVWSEIMNEGITNIYVYAKQNQ